MARLAVALVLIMAAAYVTADEESKCAIVKHRVFPYNAREVEADIVKLVEDCPCGSICNDGICEQGCKLYDTFIAAGSESEVYGRKCRCGDTPDERGMVLKCEEGVEFIGAPEGVAEWENNPACKEADNTVA
ncbi:uncharacterized protein LOC123553515 [Mercenaria mercenaria]|uniref:uncharacterized protein LOC123553515 n=1 Tax=Mercenaria mercenaria TaxID=6596 RepID=UPI00234E5678|nr:uncharacterized protein LOC123553515 [Mercenaria mercenaria]